MTTLEIEIAIMQHIGVRQHMIVHGVSWGLFLGGRYLHECDLLSLTKTGYATEIEIKISKADLLKDKNKKHGHLHNHIKYLYFAVPEKLKDIALQEIPERAGLFVIKQISYKYKKGSKNVVDLVKRPKINKEVQKWNDADRAALARLGVMRILTLKQNIHKLKSKK